jgi:hypothetical protein
VTASVALAELVDPAPADVDADPRAWLSALGRPTVVRLTGVDRARCRAVSTLVHGDEPSGFLALHAFLRAGARPATDVVATIAAVDAASAPPGFAHRFLPTRRDLNRRFPVDAAPPPPPASVDVDDALARAVFDVFAARPLEALVDLHNNSGRNPCYGLVPVVDAARLQVVALFGTALVMDAGRLPGTLTDALAARTVTATIECGQGGDARADETARVGLHAFLMRPRLFDGPPPAFAVFAGNQPVRLAPDAVVAFGAAPVDGADLTLFPDVDRFNFTTMPPGTALGVVGGRGVFPLVVPTPDGGDAARALFAVRGDRLVTARDVTPVMMTTRLAAARGDCLCYVVAVR